MVRDRDTGSVKRLEAHFLDLRLVIDESSDSACQIFVYDEVNCEVLYVGTRSSGDAAKAAAVEFAIGCVFGSGSNLEPEVVSRSLPWTRADVAR